MRDLQHNTARFIKNNREQAKGFALISVIWTKLQQLSDLLRLQSSARKCPKNLTKPESCSRKLVVIPAKEVLVSLKETLRHAQFLEISYKVKKVKKHSWLEKELKSPEKMIFKELWEATNILTLFLKPFWLFQPRDFSSGALFKWPWARTNTQKHTHTPSGIPDPVELPASPTLSLSCFITF